MAKARDRTEDFKDAVHRAAISLGYSESKMAAILASFIMQKPRERSPFTKAALKTLESIGALDQFLMKHKKDYIDPHRTTEQERDSIEHEVTVFIKACKEQIDILKTSIREHEISGKSWLGIRGENVNADTIAHKHGVVLILSEGLHAVTSQFDQLRAVRFQEAINKAIPRRKAKLNEAKNAKMLSDTSTSDSINSEARKSDDVQLETGGTVQQQLLDDETRALQIELSSLFDVVQETKTKMVEMSALNHLTSTLPEAAHPEVKETNENRATAEGGHGPAESEELVEEVQLDTRRRSKRHKIGGGKDGPDKRHKSRSKDKQPEGTSGDLHLEDSDEGNMVADPPGRSFRAERMPRITGQSVLNSKVRGPSWLSFSDGQVRADQVQIDQMMTQDVVATMADHQMKAIQYQINLAARAGRFLRESDKKNDQLELLEKRYADKVMELETAMTSHSADLKELTIERKRSAELEAAFQKLKLENEAEKTARETDKAKAEACFRKIIEELEKSGPVLRIESARAFMKSRTFKEFLVDQIVSDLTRALKVGVGQLKKKGLLPVDFEEYDIDFCLDANGEVPPDSGEVDDRVLVEDEFFELLEFDPTSEADKDSFLEEISRLKLTIASEAKEAGLTLLGCRSIDSGVVGHKGTGWKDLADSSRTTEKAVEKEVSDGTSPGQSR